MLAASAAAMRSFARAAASAISVRRCAVGTGGVGVGSVSVSVSGGRRCRCRCRCRRRRGRPARRRQRARVVEAIAHVVRGSGARVQRRQTERRLAETDEADVRMLLVRDVGGLRVRAEDEARDAVAVAELRAVAPLLHLRRIDVVGPAAPVVPRDEDRGLVPEPARDDRLDLLSRPRRAVRDVADAVLPVGGGVGRMLAEDVARVDPRDGRQLARCGVGGELRRGELLSGERLDELEGVAAVVAPRVPGLLELGRERRDVHHLRRLHPVVARRVVDPRRVGRDQHQVVRRRRPGDLGEVPVAERVLLRVRPVGRDVARAVLLAHRAGRAVQPGLVRVARVDGRRVRGVRERAVSVGAREPSEVVVVAVVLLDEE